MSPVIAKEDQNKAVLFVYIAAKDVLAALYYTNKMECVSFKSGCVVLEAKHFGSYW